MYKHNFRFSHRPKPFIFLFFIPFICFGFKLYFVVYLQARPVYLKNRLIRSTINIIRRQFIKKTQYNAYGKYNIQKPNDKQCRKKTKYTVMGGGGSSTQSKSIHCRELSANSMNTELTIF